MRAWAESQASWSEGQISQKNYIAYKSSQAVSFHFMTRTEIILVCPKISAGFHCQLNGHYNIETEFFLRTEEHWKNRTHPRSQNCASRIFLAGSNNREILMFHLSPECIFTSFFIPSRWLVILSSTKSKSIVRSLFYFLLFWRLKFVKAVLTANNLPGEPTPSRLTENEAAKNRLGIFYSSSQKLLGGWAQLEVSRRICPFDFLQHLPWRIKSLKTAWEQNKNCHCRHWTEVQFFSDGFH